MKRNLILMLIVFLLFSALLTACNQPEPEPTTELVPTAEPIFPPEPTVVVEPTAEPTSEPEPEPAPTEAAPAPTPTQTPANQNLVEIESDDEINLTELWSYGLTSIRTGEPLIAEGDEHQLDENLISYGYNLVVDKNGNVLSPRAAPLHGGEQLILTEEYQSDHNVREYARIYTIMAPIRDAILYHFEEMTREEWLEITAVLMLNNIKTKDAAEINGRSILSTEQVYDYVASGNAEGSPVMRYLEEAGLELKCLAFQDFDFTNPEGKNHCVEQNIEIGAGILDF